jgi:type I restriction enzyme, S subunit
MIPPLSEQRRIAAILDKADAIRRKREEGIRLTEELLRSTFLEMFGDPVANERGWPRKALSEVLDNIDSGWSPKCHDRRAQGDEWAVLKLGAVTYCKYQPEENKALPDSEQPQPDLEVKVGDLLMTRKNTYDLVAASAFVFETPPRLMLPDLIFRLRIKEKAPVRAEYLWGLLTHPGKRRSIQSLAGGTAGSMPNISKGKLLSQLIELPPAPLQDRFAEFMHGQHRMKKRRLELIAEQDSLFAALVQRAFRGELTNGKDA